jgi:hypothetical protein
VTGVDLEDYVKIPKHEPSKKSKGAKKTRLTLADMPHVDSAFVDVTSVADALDGLTSVISTFVTNERDGANGASLYSSPDGYPVKVQLNDPVTLTLAANDYDDTMERFVTALERIADSAAKLAGLTRPRLESWHEQEEYTPRLKDVACDGGAPGPKISV